LCGPRQVPALIYNVAYALNAGYVMKSPGYKALSCVRNLLVNVNSAINFLLYCVFGQKFRRVFLTTFCRQCPRKVCGNSVSTGSARSAGGVSTGSGRFAGNHGNSSIRSAGGVSTGSGRFADHVGTGSARSTGVVSTAGICGHIIGGGIDVFDNIPLDQRERGLKRLSIGDDDVITCNSLITGSLRTRSGDSTRRLLQTGSGVLCEGGIVVASSGGGGQQAGRLVHCRLLSQEDPSNSKLPMFV
jgi:hypothetical protein